LKANAGLATEKARKGWRTDYKNCTATASLYMNTALPPELFRIVPGKTVGVAPSLAQEYLQPSKQIRGR